MTRDKSQRITLVQQYADKLTKQQGLYDITQRTIKH